MDEPEKVNFEDLKPGTVVNRWVGKVLTGSKVVPIPYDGSTRQQRRAIVRMNDSAKR